MDHFFRCKLINFVVAQAGKLRQDLPEVTLEENGDLHGLDQQMKEVVAQVEQSYNQVRDDTRSLQTELLNVIQNQPLGCVAYFRNSQ